MGFFWPQASGFDVLFKTKTKKKQLDTPKSDLIDIFNRGNEMKTPH